MRKEPPILGSTMDIMNFVNAGDLTSLSNSTMSIATIHVSTCHITGTWSTRLIWSYKEH